MTNEHDLHTVPDRLRAWLFDGGSLTASVQAACRQAGLPNGFHMRVLAQTECVPHADESNLLNLPLGDSAIVREVHLMCAEVAWVYARSVIPLTTAVGEQRYLMQMGENPLGAALFTDPTMQRGDLELVNLKSNSRIADRQAVEDDCLWGRRSVFWVGAKPLLVAEYFLPAIPDHPEAAL